MGMRQKGSALFSPLLFCWIIRNWAQLQLKVCHSGRTAAVRVSNNLFSWEYVLLFFFFYCLSPH